MADLLLVFVVTMECVFRVFCTVLTGSAPKKNLLFSLLLSSHSVLVSIAADSKNKTLQLLPFLLTVFQADLVFCFFLNHLSFLH